MRNPVHYLKLLRPKQWIKNLLLLFPPFFGGKLFEPSVLTVILPAFLSFSCAASCCYIANDIKDREFDRRHPINKDRVIARGDVSITIASVLAVFLFLTAIVMAYTVSLRFEGFIIAYCLLTFGYTFYFKNLVILDIFFIAFGFLLRVLAGGTAFHIAISNWLFLTVFMVALFLAAGKRLGELISWGEDAGKQRQSLKQYSQSFLEGILWSSASSAFIAYALYVIENRDGLIYTVPLAAFGLFRYIYIAKEGKGDPTEALLKDAHIMVIGIIWGCMIGLIIYNIL
jgi:decaprenyl-phosphate phosphoribosyltransferase